MKYLVLILLLAFPFSGVFAQLPDYSATIKLTWSKDPKTFNGSTRGRATIENGNPCADNGRHLRGCFAFVLPSWSGAWNHWIDDSTFSEMANRRHYNVIRAMFYQRGPFVSEPANSANILDTNDAKYYGRLLVNKAAQWGFYVVLDFHSGPGYGGDTSYCVKWWSAMANTFKNDANVIFCLVDEPAGDANGDGSYGSCVDYTAADIAFQMRLYNHVRRIAPSTMQVLWEISGCNYTNLRNPKQLADLGQASPEPDVDYANAVIGWHAYPGLKNGQASLWQQWRQYYPLWMDSFSPDETFGPMNWGTWNFGPFVDTLETYGMSWVELKGFPWKDPHVTISGTVTLPNAPVLLAPADGSRESSSSVQFTWAAATSATSYRLQVGTDAAMTGVIADQAGLSVSSSVVDSLVTGSRYYWRVTASNDAGTGPWSAVQSFTAGTDASVGKNLLSNSDFDAGTSAWTFYTNGTGSMQQVSPGYDGSQAASLIITRSGSNTQLYQNSVPQEVNAKYRLSFAAYANRANGFDVVLQQHGSPYANYGLRKHIALSTVWALYSVEFSSTVSASVSDGRLMFQLGSSAVSGDQYWIDRVVMEKIGSTPSTPPDQAPAGYALLQNYPNPFNPSTTIRYALPQRSQVTLMIFNTLGQQVAILVNGEIEEGYHEVKFDAAGLASGVYFYRLQAGDYAQMRTLCLIK